MIYTFYSYKGGVGRSMALANVAETFFRAGLNVLMVDWDLEAPGLDKFFSEASAGDACRGIMDMLLDFKARMSEGIEITADQIQAKELPFEHPENFARVIHQDKNHKINGKISEGEAHTLRLIASGCPEENRAEYSHKVLNFDWRSFYIDWAGESYIEWLRQKFNQMADVVLIDSRTGLSEMGGICAVHMADVVVMFTAASEQSLDGTISMLDNLFRPEVAQARGEQRPMKALVIPSRVETDNSPEQTDQFERRFKERFKNYTPAELGAGENILWSLYIPYKPLYAFRERIATLEDTTAARELSARYDKLTFALALLAAPESTINAAFAKTEIDIQGNKLAATVINKTIVMLQESGEFWTEEYQQDGTSSVETPQDRIRRALEVFNQGDYEFVITLLEPLTPNELGYLNGANLLERARNEWKYVQQTVSLIDQAIEKKNWSGAQQGIEQLQSRYPKAPKAWQPVAQRVYLAQAAVNRAQLDNIVNQDDISAAPFWINEIKAATDRLLTLKNDHIEAKRLLREATVIEKMLPLLAQMQVEYKRQRYDKALDIINQTVDLVSQAAQDGCDMRVLLPGVKNLHINVQKEADNQRLEEELLARAEEIETRHPDKAQQLYLKLQEARVMELRQRAAFGLQRVESALRQYQQLLQNARNAGTPAGTVEAYKQALALWPEAEPTQQALLGALFQAAEKARSDGFIADLEYYNQCLESLLADNPALKPRWDHLRIRPLITVILAQLKDDIREIESIPGGSASEYEGLHNRLEAELNPYLSDIASFPDLEANFKQQREDLERRIAAWKRYDDESAQIKKLIGDGALEQAQKRLDDLQIQYRSQQAFKTNLAELEGAIKASMDAVNKCKALCQTIDAGYTDLLDSGWVKWSSNRLEINIANMENVLQNAQQAADVIGARLPPSLAGTQGDIQRHRKCLDMLKAVRALEATEPEYAYRRLQEFVNQYGMTDYLDVVTRHLQEKLKTRIPQMMGQIEAALKVEPLSEVDRLLSLARLVVSEDAGKEKLLQFQAVYNDRLKLEESYKRVFHGFVPEMVGEPELVAAYRQEITALCESPSSYLPAESIDLISAVLQNCEREQGVNLTRQGEWREVQKSLSDVRKIRSQSWAIAPVLALLETYLNVFQDMALKKLCAEALTFEELRTAYRATSWLAIDDARRDDLVDSARHLEKKMQNQLEILVKGQLARVDVYLEDENIEMAGELLDQMQQAWLTGTDKDLQPLFASNRPLEKLQHEFAGRQRRIAVIRQKAGHYDKLLSNLEENFYRETNIDKMNKGLLVLSEVELADLPKQRRRYESLKRWVQEYYRDQAHQVLTQRLEALEVELTLNPDKKPTLEGILEQLRALWGQLPKEGVATLSDEDRQRYEVFLGKVTQRYERLGQYEQWLEQYRDAQSTGDWKRAEDALKKSEQCADSETQRIELQQHIQNVQIKLEQQKSSSQTIEDGRKLLLEGDYSAARTKFQNVQRTDPRIEDLINVARAGQLFDDARNAWSGEGVENARFYLDQAAKKLATIPQDDGLPEAVDLQEKIQLLQNRLDRESERIIAEKKLEHLFERELASGKLESAADCVEKLQKIQPYHPQLPQMQSDLAKAQEIFRLLKDTEDACTEGRIPEAVTRVKLVLDKQPDNIEANLLKTRLVELVNIYDLLLEARRYKAQNQIDKAWEKYHESLAYRPEDAWMKQTRLILEQ